MRENPFYLLLGHSSGAQTHKRKSGKFILSLLGALARGTNWHQKCGKYRFPNDHECRNKVLALVGGPNGARSHQPVQGPCSCTSGSSGTDFPHEPPVSCTTQTEWFLDSFKRIHLRRFYAKQWNRRRFITTKFLKQWNRRRYFFIKKLFELTKQNEPSHTIYIFSRFDKVDQKLDIYWSILIFTLFTNQFFMFTKMFICDQIGLTT